MKKKIVIFILLPFVLFSCIKQKQEKDNDKLIEVYPDAEMKTILDSFIVSCNDKSLIYELYIDKIRNWDYDIVLYAGKKSLVRNGHPIMKTRISDIDIYIYSGVERYFQASPSPSLSLRTDSLPEEIPEGNYWTITDENEKISIFKNCQSFPFYGSYRIKFVAPVVPDN